MGHVLLTTIQLYLYCSSRKKGHVHGVDGRDLVKPWTRACYLEAVKPLMHLQIGIRIEYSIIWKMHW